MKTNKAQLTLAAAVIALLIFAVGQYIGSNEDAASPAAEGFVNNQERVQAEVAEEAPLAVDIEDDADNRSTTSIDEQSAPIASEVRQLFSSPDYDSDEYRRANAESSAILAAYDPGYSRNMIVKTDVGTIDDLIRVVESNPDGFDAPFELSPYSDVPCVVSSIRGTTPNFVPGAGEVPTEYWVDMKCEPASTTARIVFLKDENIFKVVLKSRVWGTFTVRSLSGWDYALGYREDSALPPLVGGEG